MVITGFSAYAQNDGPIRERIHAIKMEYITRRIHLTSTQSGAFLPLYDQYEQEIRNLRRSYKEKFKCDKKNDGADDMTIRKYVDDNLDYQQHVLDIKKKYQEQFLKVISQEQLTDLYEAEREFKKMLMQRIRENKTKESAVSNWRW